MIKGVADGEVVNVKLKGTPVDLLTELQLLNMYVLEELAESSNTDAGQLAKEMSRILIETVEERINK